MRLDQSRLFAAIILAAALAAPLSPAAQRPKEARHGLDHAVFALPELRVPETPMDADSVREALPSIREVDLFRAENGAHWKVTIDARRGVPTLVDGGAIPFLPGAASPVPWESVSAGCRENACISQAHAEREARAFLERYRVLFGVDPADLVLDPAGTAALGSTVYLMRFGWTHGGVPVEGASVYFRINGGNLIQVATEGIGPIGSLDPSPRISPETAWQILGGYLGDLIESPTRVLDGGSLRIIPVTPRGMDPEVFEGAPGSRIGYRLVYRLLFEQDGVVGRWEALVDAHSGEIVAFRDSLRSGHVHGGVYPSDGHTGESDRPFPFADTGSGYSDAGGNFPGTTATVTLQGKYTRMSDQCGAVSNTTTTGDVDFGMGPGTDCAVPDPNSGGPGNTHATRTLFYHVTAINMKARTYLPSNSWLNSGHITIIVNQSPWCNAMSGGDTLYFYKASSGCWNFGEIPTVALHEWGHSMDSYDGSGGIQPSGEARADWTAHLQTHDSCGGRGGLTGNCHGYGDPCTSCTGIREADWAKHGSHTPWTPQNNGQTPPGYRCSNDSYAGPCGWEDHCEAGIATQALWDFVNRDLVAPPTNLDITSAWQLADRLHYLGLPTQGTMYACSGSGTKSSDGCNGGSLYNVMRAIDDDGDGTGNGTPHAAAIYASMARHNIACGTASDPANQNSSSCAALLAPTLAGSAGSNQAILTWGAVAGAVRYAVYRNDTSCNAGYMRLGTVDAPGTNFTDTTAANGLTSYYRVQALGVSDSCVSPMSNCATVTPLPCAGAVTLGYSVYGCSDAVAIQVLDSDLMGNGTQTVSIWSNTETTPETVTLAELPSSPGTFQGTFPTSGGPAVHGDGQISIVHGNTVTVRYIDASYCGTPNVNVDSTAVADCQGPAITNVRTTSVTDQTATIAWTTSEPANSRVTYGSSQPPTAVKEEPTTLVTGHSLTVAGLDPCTTYFYSVASADRAGNLTLDDQNGAYFTFTTPGRFFGFGPDDVESGPGQWTPSSSGSTVWHIDTCKAFSGTHAWKLGAATCPGQYGSNITADLTSPTVDLGNPGHGYRLRWAQWYSTESAYDFCTAQISTNGGSTWTNIGARVSGFSNGWQTPQVDLASYSGPVKFRFHFTSDQATVQEGWYVDDIDISHDDDCQGLPCILTCGATVPASALINTAVSFQGSATATQCYGTPAYLWSFGDGATSTQKSPSHTYPTAGTYAWTLTTTVDQETCTDSGSITIVPPCTMTCSASGRPDGGAAPLLVNFSASATASSCGSGSMAYYWDFGDGVTSAQKNPSHTYAQPGTYAWTLTAVYNGNVCTKGGTVTVTAPCSVTCTATASPSAGTAPLQVAFAASATATNCSVSPTYSWAFGDGANSSQQNPSHTYSEPGSYPWTLTVSVGGTTCSEAGTVTVGDPCSPACTATVPQGGRVGDPLNFEASAEIGGCTGTASFAWDFGDGATSGQQSATHAYAATGTFTWTLTVTVDGRTCAQTGTLIVGEPCALICEASATPASGEAPLTVTFAGSATATNCTGEPSFSWDFGDGGSSPLHNPHHAYSQAGTYTWTLTVAVEGQTCARTGIVTVEEPCALACEASAAPASGPAPLTVTFAATATASHCAGEPSYTWDFGDGFTSAQQSPSHAYSSAGSYTWFLTVAVDGKSCWKTGTVSVAEPCIVICEASASPTSGSAPLAVAFAASATASNCSAQPTYSWAFGDGGASAEQNPNHTYAGAGTFFWSLSVSADGVTCTHSGTVTVEPGLPGDANGDGVVSVGEVQQAINMFLGTQPPGNGVDCNGDGVVSVGEVQKVINAFLGMASSC